LDEIQKIPNWSDIVKILWETDTAQNLNLKVMVLGSSTLIIQTGLAESLAGRFERISISHWSYRNALKPLDGLLSSISFLADTQGPPS